MKTGLDYLLVSYYEVDCHGHKPDWQQVFSQLATMFPQLEARHFRVWLVRQESFKLDG